MVTQNKWWVWDAFDHKILAPHIKTGCRWAFLKRQYENPILQTSSDCAGVTESETEMHPWCSVFTAAYKHNHPASKIMCRQIISLLWKWIGICNVATYALSCNYAVGSWYKLFSIGQQSAVNIPPEIISIRHADCRYAYMFCLSLYINSVTSTKLLFLISKFTTSGTAEKPARQQTLWCDIQINVVIICRQIYV